MKILIIEDEAQAAWNLRESIQRLRQEADIIGTVDSVMEVVHWFQTAEQPDLIFSDIQLGDGTVFDAFQQIPISCPVIFCTAYDEYFLKAFQSNGIDYLLKPVDDKELKRSFDKIEMIHRSLVGGSQEQALEKIMHRVLTQKRQYKSNFLFFHRDKLIPVSITQIAYFKVSETSSDVGLLDGRTYHHNFKLDYLTSVLDTSLFYRVSRQYLIHISAIDNIEYYDERKLLVHLKAPCMEKIVVSKAKASQFLQWIEGR
jgi:DNA-binding LytR/AlgR family response regulator